MIRPNRRQGARKSEAFRVERDATFQCWRVVAPESAVWPTVGRYRYRNLVRALRVARACRAGQMQWLVASDEQDLAADWIDVPVPRLCQCDLVLLVLGGAQGMFDRYEDADAAVWVAMQADPAERAIFYPLPVTQVACSDQVHAAARRRAAQR
jgi:hypothetical protein